MLLRRPVAVVFLSLAAMACVFIDEGPNVELIRERSPNGAHDALVFLRGGSAIDLPTAQVSVVAADDPPTGIGNAYVAASDLGIQPVWHGPDTLVLVASSFLDGRTRNRSVDGVQLTTLELLDLEGEARARESREFTLWQIEATAETMIQLWSAGEDADSLLAFGYPLGSEGVRRLHYLAHDAWGRKLAVDVEDDAFTLSSAGPDRQAGTDDDLRLRFRR